MNAPSLIGFGIGVAAVGGIFGLLSIRKPDLAMFKKYTQKQFYRTQGMLGAFFVLGLLLALEGAILLLGVVEGENPAAALLGCGVGLAVVCAVFGLLSHFKPDLGIFRNYTEKKLWQLQGWLMAAAAFGVVFIILGLSGKPWAV